MNKYENCLTLADMMAVDMEEAEKNKIDKNNKIIIDSVNVAECEYFIKLDDNKNSCSSEWKKCNKTPNCYFKQLQREKKKNEELERVLKQIRQIRFDTVYYADSEDEIILLINKTLGDIPDYD